MPAARPQHSRYLVDTTTSPPDQANNPCRCCCVRHCGGTNILTRPSVAHVTRASCTAARRYQAKAKSGTVKHTSFTRISEGTVTRAQPTAIRRPKCRHDVQARLRRVHCEPADRLPRRVRLHLGGHLPVNELPEPKVAVLLQTQHIQSRHCELPVRVAGNCSEAWLRQSWRARL